MPCLHQSTGLPTGNSKMSSPVVIDAARSMRQHQVDVYIRPHDAAILLRSEKPKIMYLGFYGDTLARTICQPSLRCVVVAKHRPKHGITCGVDADEGFLQLAQ